VDDSNSSKDVYQNNTFNNGTVGFVIDTPFGTKVLGNSANANAQTGFEFDNLASPSSLTASNNTANNNGNWGFYAAYPAFGGNNHARGNGAQNCYGVTCS
jgi:hypothetical protein